MKNSIVLMAGLLSMPLIQANGIIVIGNNSNGEEIVYETKAEKVTKALIEANFLNKELALEVLEKNSSQSSWKLSQFTIGLGVEGEAGIGPWNLGLAIKQRLVFKR